ncbi:S8 family serine peptidase [Actinomadura verrucosospora]|uniref:Peptidase S8/S53 subtilisin kexin sedolisin n=1 Tax=Actinomadura verrucosospora TaxID=46165 RepID=A0A7D3ZXW4_ACTVE|nr:S8 family serine peptidase [Actinomadura verrucosospora]QKG22446.1 peptidase S8/S53 subtilisin kexin sedolisin [Actinomadura verrucosospora]
MRAIGLIAAGVLLASSYPALQTAGAPAAAAARPMAEPSPKTSPSKKPSSKPTSKPSTKPSAKTSPKPPTTAPPPPSQAPVTCDLPRGYRGTIKESWAQKRLAFQGVWGLTQGQGVKVAVVDSGADTGHPMLDGRVADYTDLTGTGRKDCAGHGTGVAALIAGRDLTPLGVPLAGVAPGARLVIVKQQNADRDEHGGERLPTAIRRAADAGVQVINVSIAAAPSSALEQAVRYAQDHDAVVVAAAGNATKDDGEDGPAYPASYPGVISVASLGEDGHRIESSGLRSRVDVGAPGKDLTIPWPGGGYNPQAEGTSFAAAYVSGVVALVRASHPGLHQDQVVRRVLSTADGNVGDGTGRGMVNPAQAVTAIVPGEDAPGAATTQPALHPVKLAAPAHPDGHTTDVAVGVAAGAVGLAALAALCGIVVPMGKRRGWRPGKVVLGGREDDEEPIVTGTEGGTIGAHH